MTGWMVSLMVSLMGSNWSIILNVPYQPVLAEQSKHANVICSCAFKFTQRGRLRNEANPLTPRRRNIYCKFPIFMETTLCRLFDNEVYYQ